MAVVIGLFAMIVLGSVAYVSIPLALGITAALVLAVKLAAPGDDTAGNTTNKS